MAEKKSEFKNKQKCQKSLKHEKFHSQKFRPTTFTDKCVIGRTKLEACTSVIKLGQEEKQKQ